MQWGSLNDKFELSRAYIYVYCPWPFSFFQLINVIIVSKLRSGILWWISAVLPTTTQFDSSRPMEKSKGSGKLRRASNAKTVISPTKRKFVSANTVSPKRLKTVLESKSGKSSLGGDDYEQKGLLEDLDPSQVSEAKLAAAVQQASTVEELFGSLSQAELIETIFKWFGESSLDVSWFFNDGTGEQPSIVASPHNRELQDSRMFLLFLLLLLPLCSCSMHCGSH